MGQRKTLNRANVFLKYHLLLRRHIFKFGFFLQVSTVTLYCVCGKQITKYRKPQRLQRGGREKECVQKKSELVDTIFVTKPTT